MGRTIPPITQMTQHIPAIRSTHLEPSALPEFVSFGSTWASEPGPNAFEDAELASLGPAVADRRRQAFRLGRAAAHAALRTLGRDDGPVLPGPGREPRWPPGIVGSISHTAELGVALAGRGSETDGVGIDVEARRHAPELADQVPRPEERAWLDRIDPAGRADAELALFSAKESIFKAFYPRVGTLFGFEAASLQPSGQGYSARLVADLDPGYPAARPFDVGCRWHGGLVMTWVVLPGSRRRP